MSMSESLMANVTHSLSSHWGWITSSLSLLAGGVSTMVATAFWGGRNVERLNNKIDNLATMMGHLNTQMADEIEKRDQHMEMTQKNAVDIATIKGQLK